MGAGSTAAHNAGCKFTKISVNVTKKNVQTSRKKGKNTKIGLPELRFHNISSLIKIF